MILPFVGLETSHLSMPKGFYHIILVNTFQLIENKKRKHFVNLYLRCPHARIFRQLVK